MPASKRAASAWSYPAFNIKVSPPPTDFRPTVTADAAWAKMVSENNGIYGKPLTELVLASVTVGKVSGGPSPPSLVYEHGIAWIAIVAGATHQFTPLPSRPNYSGPKTICTQDDPSEGTITVMDATSGDPIVSGAGSVLTVRSLL